MQLQFTPELLDQTVLRLVEWPLTQGQPQLTFLEFAHFRHRWEQTYVIGQKLLNALTYYAQNDSFSFSYFYASIQFGPFLLIFRLHHPFYELSNAMMTSSISLIKQIITDQL